MHPKISDDLKLALHGAGSATYRGRDLFHSMPFHPPDRNLTQVVGPKKLEESRTLFSHLGGQFRRRLSAEDLFEKKVFRQVVVCQARMAAAFLAPFGTEQPPGLASRHDCEDAPQVVSIGKLRKPSAFGIPAEAIERAQRNIFLVRQPGSSISCSFRAQD